MSTAQQVKNSLCFIDEILALAAKKKWSVVEIATEDLQALADEVRRLSKDE